MRKVIVIGSPGSGKSVFSRKLREKTGLPIYYLDVIYHRPDGTFMPNDQFETEINKIMEKDCWIIDGNYGSRSIESRLEKCDTVFLLDYPVDVCIEGARSRIGNNREDYPWAEEDFKDDFEQWIRDFPITRLPKIYELLEKYRDIREIRVFRSREEADDYLKEFS